jgi:hypothetical protein
MHLGHLVFPLVLLATACVTASAADCPALLAQHLQTDPALPFEAFDQDDH